MKASDAEYRILKFGFPNIEFLMIFNGFAGLFRLNYLDKTPRKNSTYKEYRTADIYFIGLPDETHGQFSKSYYVRSVTDATLTLERHGQWLLEHLMRQHEKEARERYLEASKLKK